MLINDGVRIHSSVLCSEGGVHESFTNAIELHTDG